jgi:hypothetical protein
MQAAGTECPGSQPSLEELTSGVVERRFLVEILGRERRVDGHATECRTFPGGEDPVGHGGRTLTSPSADQVGRVRRVDAYRQVETVEQRPRKTPGVSGPCRWRTTTAPGNSGLTARARVHRPNQQEPGRVGDRSTGPADPDYTVLQGLAQRVEDGSGELAEFVEEQNAPMDNGALMSLE